MGPCTGGGYNASGWIGKAVDGADLPSAYGAAWDGSCVVGLGDPGLVFTVDPVGSSPCTSLHTGTAPRTVDLRDQRCDGTIGNASWDKVALVNTDTAGGSELKSVVVTVRDAQTGAILLKSEAIGTNGLIDLAGIDPVAHPALTMDALTTSVSGNPAWADGVAPRIRVSWHADPKQACFETTTPSDCALAFPAMLGFAVGPRGDDRPSRVAARANAPGVVRGQPCAGRFERRVVAGSGHVKGRDDGRER